MAKPNILLIVADDLGVDALRIVNGQVNAQVDGPKTAKSNGPLPNLGRLVQAGVHFTHAWAHPVCSPTRGSLFTGLTPWKHTVGFPDPGGNGQLPNTDASDAHAAIHLLPERLRTQGYRCGMFGKWDLGRGRTPIDWGWDHFEGMYEGGLRNLMSDYYGGDPNATGRVSLQTMRNIVHATTKPQRDRAIASCKAYLERVCAPQFVEGQPDVRFYVWEKTIEDRSGTRLKQYPFQREHLYATIDEVESAKAWITQQAGNPWCVALTLIIPHDPFHVPPRESYRIAFADPNAPTLQELFIAMIESMDFYIGKLLDAPELREQLANTVIVFVGDNGTQDRDPDTAEQLDNDLQDKNSHFIGGVHVPMIVADGGVLHGRAPCYLVDGWGRPTAGTATPSVVHITDLYKTALDVAEASPAGAVDSIGMRAHLKRTGEAPRAYVLSQQYPLAAVPRRAVGKHASVSDGKYKLSCVRRRTPPGTPDEYDYSLSVLVPSTKIPGALDEVSKDLLDPAYSGKLRELWLELREHRLDSGTNDSGQPLPFPPLPQPPASTAPPSLNQFAANPMGSANYSFGFRSIPNMPLKNAPADADLGRWAMLNDNGGYFFSCMRKDRSDSILVFGFDGQGYAFGAGPFREFKIAGFPADADTTRFGLIHDNFGAHLTMRRRGAQPAFYRAPLMGDTFLYGSQDGLPNTIPVHGAGPDTDWGRWSMVHDNATVILVTMMVGDNTRVQRLPYDMQNGFFKLLDSGTLSGAPANCDYRSFAVLHDNADHRLYFQTR